MVLRSVCQQAKLGYTVRTRFSEPIYTETRREVDVLLGVYREDSLERLPASTSGYRKIGTCGHVDDERVRCILKFFEYDGEWMCLGYMRRDAKEGNGEQNIDDDTHCIYTFP